jgi:putative glutamine amidotransferase
MSAARPRVLLSTASSWRERPLRRFDALTGRAYSEAAVEVGLLPSMVATLDPSLADEALDGIDGLLLTGGGDVDPAFFGAAPDPDLGEVDRERDAFELALYRAARERGLPVLGICRGIQLIAVAEGGDLIQHLAPRPGAVQHEQAARDGDPIHAIRIEAGSHLARAFGGEEARVNSYHHQAVGRLPDALRTVASAPDGVIEAIEGRGGPFLQAVQWHPELAFRRHPEQLAPFRAFAGAAGAT